MNTHITLTDHPHLSTYGGEHWSDGYHFDDFGIQLGDISIDGFTKTEFERLTVIMIDHLIANGTRFEINRDGAKVV